MSTRATATILFTDLVGSTELRGRLGDTAAEDLRRRHDAALSKAVADHDGRVVKGLGDGVMATFTGAADAVAAAVAIQQAIDRLNRSGKSAVPLEVRIGLSAGDVAFEDDDVHGTPVVEASRLCGAAAGGEILAADLVRALAGSATEARFTSVGPLELKGLAQGLPAVRVDWEPAAASTIPLPSLLANVGRIFVGRDDELERLGQLWKEAAAGERRVALLAGEPGVGKTRLAAELAVSMDAESAAVLAGRCDEDLGVPYQPFVEALRHFIDHTSLEHLQERLGRFGGELIRLVPELAERLPDLPPPLRSDPETERYRLFDAVAGWLAALSAEEPLLVVLDDLQWAAKPTLLLLRHLLRSAEPMRLLVVATYRDTDIGRDHPLADFLADARRVQGTERFPLVGLDASGVAAFLEQAAGHALDDEGETLARAVWQETEGNPFFVAEVLRHLSESGALERRGERWVATAAVEELGIPEGVRDVVGRRLSRLSDDANRVLACASVVGTEFEPAVVQMAGGFSEEAVLSSLEEAVRTRLVVDVSGGRSRFAHALVRATLYDELTAPRRIALHRKVAEALETVHGGALDDDLPALAYHWARASGPAQTDKAVEYAIRAGDRALAQLAHDEAVAYYRDALGLLEVTAGDVEEPRRLHLLLSMGEAQRRAGHPAHRETLLHAADLASRRGDTAALVRAALANTRGILPTQVGTVDGDKVAVLEAAIDAVGDGQAPWRARLLATLGVELSFAGDWRRCLALSDEALALARSIGEHETLAWVLLARQYPASVPNLLDERLANTAELLRVMDAVPDPALTAEAHLLRGRTATEAGDMGEADRCCRIADELSEKLGQPALRWRVAYIAATRAIVAGRFSDAEQLLSRSHDLGQTTGQADAEAIFLIQRLHLHMAHGRFDDDTTDIVRSGRRPLDVPWADSILAVAACDLGFEVQARTALEQSAPTSIPFDIYWLAAMANWAAVAAHLHDAAHAERLEAALRPYARQAVPLVAAPTPSVAHHLGMVATTLGHHDHAERHFRAAVAIHDRIGAPHWVARTRLEWARMLLTRRRPGDVERARELLGQALGTARELGLGAVERGAVALMAEAS
jgi:class 3 adenylate cyclase/tetratricopeptide (TPR) repeat protein